MKPSVENAVARAGILVEPLAQPVDVAERRCLEDVELRIGGQQRVGRPSIEAVARQHQRRNTASVARRGQRSVRGDELGDASGIVRIDGVDEVLLGHGCDIVPRGSSGRALL